MKPKRIKDEFLLKEIRSNPCLVCGQQAETAHIKSRGAGGSDIPENLLPLCRRHHSEQHQIGFVRFSRKYSRVAWKLLELGWEVVNVLGVEKLIHNDHKFKE